jgi:superfamily II DNA or RNA helicase
MSETPRRRLPRADREMLYLRDAGKCHRCGAAISIETFHAAHIRAQSHGGPVILENLEAWCRCCNLTNGARDVRDPRVGLRPWQERALDLIVERLAATGVATLAAAPGAGKTLFGAFAFEAMYAADRVDRLAIFVPRRTIVEQWVRSWERGRHLQLRPGAAVERDDQVGVVATYQSLTLDRLRVHQLRAAASRTLVIADEVHHCGERVGGRRPAWSDMLMQLVGEIDALNVVAVLNLSGTLWRSQPGERISTVRYVPDDEKAGWWSAVVDFDVPPAELVAAGELRPVDLFRLGATVEVVDLKNATRIEGRTVDLTEPLEGVALLKLPDDPEWRRRFVEAVLDRQERLHKDFGGNPVKALIVAGSVAHARAFRDTTNEILRARRLGWRAQVATSDEEQAAATLAYFKRQPRTGLLCTVDMASEGYDCPEIAVIGYASHKRTPLYIRQVVARAQRVTAYERERLRRPFPAAVIVPDVPKLVETMKALLAPMRHETEDRAPEDRAAVDIGPPPLQPRLPRYDLDSVSELLDGDVHVTGDSPDDVSMDEVRHAEPFFEANGIPVSFTPRAIVALNHAYRARRDAQPFRPLAPEEADLADGELRPAASPGGLRERPLSTEDHCERLRAEIRRCEGWTIKNDRERPQRHIVADTNRAGGITSGNRPDATPEQLGAALAFARARIRAFCATRGMVIPSFACDPDEP